MIIDAHTHISKMPDSRYSESFEKNLDFMLEEMKANSIDHAVLIAGFHRDDDGFNISTKSLVRLAFGESNIHVVGSIDVLNYTHDDLLQLHGWVDAGYLVAIKLYTGYQHFFPENKRCWPIYDLGIAYGIPVIFHSGDTLAGIIPNPKLKYAQPLAIDDVAADWPDLKIIIAHMGNPSLDDCAAVLYKNPNVYADISGLIVGDGFSGRYGALMREKIDDLVVYVSSEGTDHKLLYGTDWPLCPMSAYRKFADSLSGSLSKEGIARLMYKNAAELFKIKIAE